ncbi:MAG: 4-hydroxy-3-methylbut-2-enyl diphosphate reductase [Spirochaetes bacterium]|nr:MAG: 4-hydroxy-3-methylbut-2-enyl diphosphate reductase [Spirochaetota bacterium]
MNCIVTEFSGFCHGVKNTISTIEKLLKDESQPVSCIGLPVHNSQITEKLITQGLNVVDKVEDIQSGILIIRAHGLPPERIEYAKKRGLKIVDTTCNIVVRVQNIAKTLHSEGYTVLITGEHEHPEVRAIYGCTQEEGIVCSSVNDVRALKLDGKVGVVSQTTFSESIFRKIVTALIERNFSELRVFDTICSTLAKRNTAAQITASQVDMMLVVGGKMSSNTKRLYEACKKINPNTYHIETKEEFSDEWFTGVETVGITAGASTPQWIIHDICNAVKAR